MVSSSKSNTSQTTKNFDERIAATDNAIVARDGSNISVLDGGAIEAAKEMGISSLTANESISKAAIEFARTLGTGSLNSIAQNADKAFDFVDNQRQDTEARVLSETIPWLVGGASLIAIAVVVYGGKSS